MGKQQHLFLSRITSSGFCDKSSIGPGLQKQFGLKSHNMLNRTLQVNDVDFPEADPETKAVEEDDFVDVGTTPMAPMATSMPMAERAVAQPQRLELRNFVSEQIQPNHRSGGVNSLDDGSLERKTQNPLGLGQNSNLCQNGIVVVCPLLCCVPLNP